MKTDQFLDLFRAYESLLRDHGKDYKEIEDKADDLIQGRMRITRQMRNYLSHSPDAGFLTPSESQGRFLKTLMEQEEQCGDILRKHLYTPKRAACQEETPICDILSQMAKERVSYMPVYRTDKVLGIVDIHKLVRIYMQDPKSILTKAVYGTYGKSVYCMGPEAPMEDVLLRASEYDVICCTEDGTVTGKFFGVLKPVH